MSRYLVALVSLAVGCASITGDERTDALYARAHMSAGDTVEITLRDGEQSGIATLTWELAEPVESTLKLRMPDPLDPEGADGSGFDPGALTWEAGETGGRSVAITTSKALLNREPDWTYADPDEWWVTVRPIIEVGEAKVPAPSVLVKVKRAE